MLRRKPTRLELKLEDVVEYEEIKAQQAPTSQSVTEKKKNNCRKNWP